MKRGRDRTVPPPFFGGMERLPQNSWSFVDITWTFVLNITWVRYNKNMSLGLPLRGRTFSDVVKSYKIYSNSIKILFFLWKILEDLKDFSRSDSLCRTDVKYKSFWLSFFTYNTHIMSTNDHEFYQDRFWSRKPQRGWKKSAQSVPSFRRNLW